MAPDQAQPHPRIAIWFFRIIGTALLASGVIDYFAADSVPSSYALIAGPLCLVAWVGCFLAFLEHRSTRPTFAVPFALIVLVIVLLAVASLVAILPGTLPTQTRLYASDAARLVHLLAALALTVIGWTARLPLRH
jgi:cytochrome bd-type quinol oxidase subunit 2